MSPNWSALLFAVGGLHVIAFCVVVRYRLPPGQPIPGHYRAVAWLGILAMTVALCFAIGNAIRA